MIIKPVTRADIREYDTKQLLERLVDDFATYFKRQGAREVVEDIEDILDGGGMHIRAKIETYLDSLKKELEDG